MPAAGLKVKADQNYEFSGIPLPEAVSRVTGFFFSALDRSARLEVSIYASDAAVVAGKPPIDCRVLIYQGETYDALLGEYPEIVWQLISKTEEIFLASEQRGVPPA